MKGVEMVRKEFTLEEVQVLIKEECDAVRDLLIEKNNSYGNSAINPKRIFSKASPVEQIKCRIDDKLSRMANDHVSKDDAINSEDVTRDLLGYLILLRVAERLHGVEL
jgi:hypothetical protein